MFASFIPSPPLLIFAFYFPVLFLLFLHINKNLGKKKKKRLDFFFITCIAKYSAYPCAASVFRETKLIKTWYQISVCARQAQLQDDGTVTRGEGERLMSRANWADQRNNDCVVPMVVVIVLLGTWSKNQKRSDQKKRRERRGMKGNEREREREKGRERKGEKKKDRSQ